MKAGTSKVAMLSIVMLAGLRSLLEDAVTTASTYEKNPNDTDAIAAPIQSTDLTTFLRVRDSLLRSSCGKSQMAATKEKKATPVTT